MSRAAIGIVDYGVGNLRSVSNAFQYLGLPSEILSDPERIETAPIVILPGVGNFGAGAAELKRRRFLEALQTRIQGNSPVIGICLGMQLLLETSDEAPKEAGLGAIPGKLRSFKTLAKAERVPSVGWRDIETTIEDHGKLATGYFVHEYFADNVPPMFVNSNYVYESNRVPAHISKGNIHGLQFHPEKSGIEGVNFLGNLVNGLLK
jgi:imidazole glycerol phosphate synthase glutamine amidotransferase subunit